VLVVPLKAASAAFSNVFLNAVRGNHAGSGDPEEMSDSMRLQSLFMQLYMASGCSLMSRFALLISLVGLRVRDSGAPPLS
jgi:hypothetical protein